MISRFHFISQESPDFTHLDCIKKACQSGVDWVQLRVKNKPIDEIIAIAKQAKLVCDDFGAKLIINDHPSVAKEVQSYGLHLGKEDMPVTEAKRIVGDKMVIGGTANTVDDILQHVDRGANYIGLGPFRFTKTKAKLSPVLGLDGYQEIMNELRRRNVNIPIIAIGGIAMSDISPIVGTGVYGIAASSLIALTDYPEQQLSAINKLLKGERSLC